MKTLVSCRKLYIDVYLNQSIDRGFLYVLVWLQNEQSKTKMTCKLPKD